MRALDFHDKLALQDEEKLPRPRMSVALLARAGRHELLGDAQVLAANEVPAIIVLTPGVVRRRRPARSEQTLNRSCGGKPRATPALSSPILDAQ